VGSSDLRHLSRYGGKLVERAFVALLDLNCIQYAQQQFRSAARCNNGWAEHLEHSAHGFAVFWLSGRHL